MLLNPNSTFQLCNIQTDPPGQFIIAKITCDELPFFVVNIYTQDDYHEQEIFICKLSKHIITKSDASKLIVSGDWNVTLTEQINTVAFHGKQQLTEMLLLILWMNLT